MAEENRKNDLIRAIVLTSFALTNFISIIVSCTCCYMWATGKEIPGPLAILLTATITYTFTTAPTMVKSYIDKGML